MTGADGPGVDCPSRRCALVLVEDGDLGEVGLTDGVAAVRSRHELDLGHAYAGERVIQRLDLSLACAEPAGMVIVPENGL